MKRSIENYLLYGQRKNLWIFFSFKACQSYFDMHKMKCYISVDWILTEWQWKCDGKVIFKNQNYTNIKKTFFFVIVRFYCLYCFESRLTMFHWYFWCRQWYLDAIISDFRDSNLHLFRLFVYNARIKFMFFLFIPPPIKQTNWSDSINSIQLFSIPHQCYIRYDFIEKCISFSFDLTVLIFDLPSQKLRSQETFTL